MNLQIVILIFYLLVLAGIFARESLLLAAALPYALYIASSILRFPSAIELSLQRTLSDNRALRGDRVTVTNRITNCGAGRLEEAHIEDLLPENLELVEGHLQMSTTLESGETIELVYTLEVKPGEFNFSAMTVTVFDHFHLRRKVANLSHSKDLIVLPKVDKLRKIPLPLNRPLQRLGVNPSRLQGAGTQFFEVREYQPGDSLRRINWHACARNPELFFTNTYEQERVADIGLILDEREARYPRHPQSRYLSYAVDATATLADSLLSGGNRVGLLIYGTIVKWTLPGYGKYQREKIFHSLSNAREGTHQVFQKMENIPTRFFPPHSQIILISPLRLEDISALIRLRARGYQLMVVLPDFTATLLEEHSMIRQQSMVRRVVKIEQTLVAQKLLQQGIFVVSWDVQSSFEQALQLHFSRFRVWQQHQGWG